MNASSLPGPSREEIARQRAAAERMFPEIDGRPGVYVEPFKKSLWVYISGKVSQLRMEVDSVWWTNEWLNQTPAWPDEITEEFVISEDCLTVGPGWWFDSYFGSWFIFDREMVAKSMAGDDSWIHAFLGLSKDQYDGPQRHH